MIRPERPRDEAAIREVTAEAFNGATGSEQAEPAIIEALRREGALTVSLVWEEGGEVIGHVAFSRVKIDGRDIGWFGLGPVSVLPAAQRRGVGQALIVEGLKQLQDLGAAGCVVVGDPEYYKRFGFPSDPRLTFAGVPQRYFQQLAFHEAKPSGSVTYHPAFGACTPTFQPPAEGSSAR